MDKVAYTDAVAANTLAPLAVGLVYNRVGSEQLIEQAVRLSDLTNGRREDIAFYVRLAAVGPIVADIFRKSGPAMSDAELRRHGLNPHLRIGVGFFDTLNAAGRADPVGAASTIATTILRMTSSRRHLDRIQERLGDHARLQIAPSVMAAGPCDAILMMADAEWPVGHAPDLPLAGCDRLGQCGCYYVVADGPLNAGGSA